jgi:hypothetical protein
VLDADSNDLIFRKLMSGPRRPTTWIDAKDIRTGLEQSLPNRMESFPNSAQRGSTSGVDSNDPLFRPHDGRHYVYFPGNLDSFVSGPTYNIAGATTLGMVVDFGPDGLPDVPSGFACPAGLATSVDGILQYVGPSKALTTFGTADSVSNTWAAGPTVPAGTRYVRSTFRVNVDVEVETSIDGTTWVPYQTTPATGQPASIPGPTNTVPIAVGRVSYAGAWSYLGSIRKVEFLVDGAVVRTYDPATQIDTSSNPNAGQTSFGGWNVNRAAEGLKTAVVTESIILPDGVNDFTQLPASDTPTFTATTGKHTQIVCGRWNDDALPLNPRLWSSESGSANGAMIYKRNMNDIWWSIILKSQ